MQLSLTIHFKNLKQYKIKKGNGNKHARREERKDGVVKKKERKRGGKKRRERIGDWEC